MLDHARLNDFSRRVDDASQNAVGAEPVPLCVARIDGGKARAFVRAAQLVEVPPRHAVHATYNRGVVANQGLHLVDNRRHRMGLERDDHIILLAQISGVVRGCDRHGDAFAVLNQGQAVRLHRSQMWSARNEADISPGLYEFDGHVATDGARAEDADFHRLRSFIMPSDQAFQPYQSAGSCRSRPWGFHPATRQNGAL